MKCIQWKYFKYFSEVCIKHMLPNLKKQDHAHEKDKRQILWLKWKDSGM